MENPHAGHRKRLRERFIKNGLDQFAEHNVLELLLFYAMPRRDTNETAHRLIDEFGSFSGVFDASFEELMKVDDIGENAASLIKLMPALCRKYLDDKNSVGTQIHSSEDGGKFLLPKFFGEISEKVLLVGMDNKGKVLGCVVICSGDICSANFTPRRVMEAALRLNATAVILAHNHPSGTALPSSDDITTTDNLFDTLKKVNIKLVDHIIVAGDDFVSMADSGCFYKQ